MKCPQCKEQTNVLDTRMPELGLVRRRRFCERCKIQFRTFERIEAEMPKPEPKPEKKRIEPKEVVKRVQVSPFAMPKSKSSKAAKPKKEKYRDPSRTIYDDDVTTCDDYDPDLERFLGIFNR